MKHFVRASASGAIALAAAQAVDMRLTGRPSSDTPVRAVERLTRHSSQTPLLRSLAGYAVQSTLAPGVHIRRARQPFARRLCSAPAMGGGDWVREATLTSALAIAVTVSL
jgi:hypothetical protein